MMLTDAKRGGAVRGLIMLAAFGAPGLSTSVGGEHAYSTPNLEEIAYEIHHGTDQLHAAMARGCSGDAPYGERYALRALAAFRDCAEEFFELVSHGSVDPHEVEGAYPKLRGAFSVAKHQARYLGLGYDDRQALKHIERNIDLLEDVVYTAQVGRYAGPDLYTLAGEFESLTDKLHEIAKKERKHRPALRWNHLAGKTVKLLDDLEEEADDFNKHVHQHRPRRFSKDIHELLGLHAEAGAGIGCFGRRVQHFYHKAGELLDVLHGLEPNCRRGCGYHAAGPPPDRKYQRPRLGHPCDRRLSHRAIPRRDYVVYPRD